MYLTALTCTAQYPQVYEDAPAESYMLTKRENKRFRSPTSHQRYQATFSPPTFNYRDAVQQDQQRMRYYAQQEADAINLARTAERIKQHAMMQGGRFRGDSARTRAKTGRNVAFEARARSFEAEEDVQQSGSERREAWVDNAMSDREDQVLNYIAPHQELYQFNHGDDIVALTSLIGKPPGDQLEGLKHLLTQEAQIQAVIPLKKPFNSKDHTPITEHVQDIENPQKRPNVKVQHAPPHLQEAVAQAHVLEAQVKEKARHLEQSIHRQNLQTLAHIQAQFDAAAHANAQRAMLQAQEKARAQVQAQHNALAYAKLEAQQRLAQAQAQARAQHQAAAHTQQLVSYTPLHQPVSVLGEGAVDHQAPETPVKPAFAPDDVSVKTLLLPVKKRYKRDQSPESFDSDYVDFDNVTSDVIDALNMDSNSNDSYVINIEVIDDEGTTMSSANSSSDDEGVDADYTELDRVGFSKNKGGIGVVEELGDDNIMILNDKYQNGDFIPLEKHPGYQAALDKSRGVRSVVVINNNVNNYNLIRKPQHVWNRFRHGKTKRPLKFRRKRKYRLVKVIKK